MTVLRPPAGQTDRRDRFPRPNRSQDSMGEVHWRRNTRMSGSDTPVGPRLANPANMHGGASAVLVVISADLPLVVYVFNDDCSHEVLLWACCAEAPLQISACACYLSTGVRCTTRGVRSAIDSGWSQA